MTTLGSVTAVLLIAAIILISTMFSTPVDDGRILKGVMAAGVNIGGMTPDQAAIALDKATANTYSKLPMMVTVLDTQIMLSPEDTGARLDIPAVVQDAYNYGRTGSRAEQNQARENASTNSVIIPITPHLNLNTDYIRSELNKLGTHFSSTLSDAWIKIEPENYQPQIGVSKPDTTVTHQTMTIFVGTPEYGLDTNKLFNQVMEYYNINILQVVGTCTVVAPDSIEDELLAYYEDLCVEPVDAQMDPITYEVTPEVYGYGFNLDEVKELIAQTPYGETLPIPLRYLAPNVTEELLADNLFKNVMGEYASPLGEDSAWTNNAILACNQLNGVILKAGETFSFNEFLGKLTADKGYQEALAYRGRNVVSVMGGGVTETASVLYNSALYAELEILEHHNHVYVPEFIEVGRDAYVDDTKDLRFRNSYSDPIRIVAEVIDGQICITIEGTDSREYFVSIDAVALNILPPENLYNVMLPENPGNYTDGQVLVQGVDGCEIKLVKLREYVGWHDEVGIGTYIYEAQDNVVVKIQSPTAPNPDMPTENP